MGASRQIVTEGAQVVRPGKTRICLEEHLRRHFEKNTVLWWVVFSFVYFLRNHSTAGRRLFWYDELFTYYLSGMPLSRLWHALLAGIDQNPPTFYLISAATRRFAWTAEVGLRIPALVGMWVMFLGMFLYVRKRSSLLYAWLAVLFISSTSVFTYATEARPYGLVLGCCAMALFAWSEAAEPSRPGWSIPLLGISLAAAGLSHAYAVLIWVPLGLGELWRACREHRMDWPVWSTLVGALSVFAIYLPIQRAIHGLLKYTWSKPDWGRIPESYAVYFQSVWLLLLAMLFLVGSFYLFRHERTRTEPASSMRIHEPLPVHEIVALVSLALLPVFGTILGRLVTGIFTGRYAIESMIALGILFAILCDRAMRGSALPALCLCLLPIGWEFGNILYFSTLPAGPSTQMQSHELRAMTDRYDLLPTIEQSDLPVVISSGDLFFEFDHYASSGLASRLHLLLDRETAIRHTQVDLFDSGLPLMAQWFPMRAHLDNYGAFVATHPHFLVYGVWESEGVHDWLVYRLMLDHMKLTNLGRTDLGRNLPFWSTIGAGWRYLYLFDVTVTPSKE